MSHRRSLVNCRFAAALVIIFGGLLSSQSPAQSFETLHNFSATASPPFGANTNSDGANPAGTLFLGGSTLYGTAQYGGGFGNGTIFAVNTDGTAFRTLHTFSDSYSFGTNGDGSAPQAGLVEVGHVLYGTANQGGASGNGTVFEVSTDTTSFTPLHQFSMADVISDSTNADGVSPNGDIVVASNVLYGTAYAGGQYGNGCIFKLNIDGTGFSVLRSFSPGNTNSAGIYTNADGIHPQAGLILAGSILYGTANSGGVWGSGMVFAVNLDGTGFTALHSFTPQDPNSGTNADGASPQASLLQSGNKLYGDAPNGGAFGNGTVFALNVDGTGFATLHSFTAQDPGTGTNSDGAFPTAALILIGQILYGTTLDGGASANGAVFALNIDGADFKNLHSFTARDPVTDTNSDGASPQSGLIQSSNVLYGTTSSGGLFGNGTVFSISLPPQLVIKSLGGQVVLSWPATSTNFVLQSSTNLLAPAWKASLSAVTINGQNIVTNPVSTTPQFFRLSK